MREEKMDSDNNKPICGISDFQEELEQIKLQHEILEKFYEEIKDLLQDFIIKRETGHVDSEKQFQSWIFVRKGMKSIAHEITKDYTFERKDECG